MSFLNFYKKITFLLCGFFFSHFSYSQPDSVNYNNLISMPLKDLLKIKVLGVSKYEESQAEAPANVIIITKEQIKANSYQDLSDLLKNVPGIDLVDNARGYGEFYILRGIQGNDRFLILVDGEKINPVSGTFLSVGNSIALNFAERVEIIFGPASVMYGADAFSGVINIISKTPNEKFLLSAKGDFGSLNTASGRISTQYKSSKNLTVSFFARYFQSDGPDFTQRDSGYMQILSYQPPLRNKFEQPIYDHTIFLKTSYKNITLSYFRQHFNEGNSLGMKQLSYIYNKEGKWAFNNNILQAAYNKILQKQSSINFSLAYINHVQDPNSLFYKMNLSVFPNQPFKQYLTGKDNSVRSQIVYNKQLYEKFKIVTGLEFEYSKSIPPYANDQVLGNSYKFEGENAKIIEQELTIEEQKLATFAQISYAIFSNLNFVIGGRYDYSKRYQSTLNPRISLVYNPFKNTSFKFIYGTAFQAPSLFYQYEQFGASTTVMLSVDEIKKTNPSWELENQIVKTFELSGNQLINENFKINISGYHSVLENLIERVNFSDSVYNKYFSTADTTIYSNGFRNENIGKQIISGIDFRVEYSISKNFYTNLSYSFIDAYSEKSTGNSPVPRIAKHKFWFGFSYQDLFKYFTLSARMKYFGDIYNCNRTSFPNGTQPGYFNIDANLLIKNLVKHTSFYVRIENILNSKYDHGGLIDQVYYLPVVAQPGIIARAGIELYLNK